ncbi:MAG TPA: hypothetical protein PKM63_02320 [Panacibacter sp.]|nr:hypothetical protein [Panacibacter sp.]HNP43090.1 hypothetical protein [Panacibacter sp.]
MRQTFFVFTVLIVLVACNNVGSANPAKETHARDPHWDTAKSARQNLVEELKKLQQVIASGDKEKIADIFPFPLSGTAFGIYINDSAYDVQFNASGNNTTKAMFLQYYNKIADAILVDQVNNLFQHLSMDSLLYKDNLKYDDYNKMEPCFYSYKIEVAKDEVILRMDMNSNSNYQSKKLSVDDLPENSSEICEHNFWWVLRFEGNTLRLASISGAD